MIRSDADALAAEIAQKYPKRIQAIVAFYRVDEAGIEQFTLRCRLLIPGERLATIYRRDQWDSLIMVWAVLLEERTPTMIRKEQGNDACTNTNDYVAETTTTERLCRYVARAAARSRKQGRQGGPRRGDGA